MKNLLFIAISILAVGCGGKDESTTETKPVEEKIVEVKEEVKPTEEASLNPNLKYEIKGDAVTITDCDEGVSGKLVISSTIEGNPVTSIGDWAFTSCTKLTSITIPDGVTSIGRAAFSDCSNLTTIEVGTGNLNYTDVNGILFNKEKTVLHTYPAGKTGANYTISNSVTSIGENAFKRCTSLTSIKIPDSVTSIGRGAFWSCRGLTSIKIPDSVTSIGTFAFADCSSLSDITIPDSVTSIGGFAFASGLPDSSNLKSITFGKNSKLTSIGNRAFRNCTSLTSITIPDSVTSIGNRAFSGCSAMTTIEVGTGNLNYTDVNGVLFNTDKTELHIYPTGNRNANYNIPDSVTSIGEKAFQFCRSLTSITFGKNSNLTNIENSAFYGCASLTSIQFPNSVTNIGDLAFGLCSGLTSINIPNGVTSIGKIAFGGCTSLTSIAIPDSVTSFEEGAFQECFSLTSITIGTGISIIEKSAFYACTSLTEVTFLGDSPKVENYVFHRATPTIYRKPEAKGWGDTWGGRPVKLISEKP